MMKEKDRYLGWEYLFTISILSFCFLMVGNTLRPFGGYLIAGLCLGFVSSWLTRNSSLRVIKLLVNVCAVLTIIWVVYSLLNSSFFYREIVVIYIKGIFILEFLLSFIAYLPQILSYMQILSLLVFMSSPLFMRGYNLFFLVFAVGYVISWVAILRIRLYSSADAVERKPAGNYYYLFFIALIFLVVLFISGVCFSKFSLGRYKRGGILPEERMEESGKLESVEKDYYDQLDKINRKIQELIPSFKLTQESRELVSLFSPLVNDSLSMQEVDKIEAGLLSYLSGSRSGIEKGDAKEIALLIKNFVDKKALLNLKKIKELILGILRKNTFTLKEKISGFSLINKTLSSDTYRQTCKLENRAKEMIENSGVDKEVKNELKGLFRLSREWKNFDFYRQKVNLLMKKIDSLDEQSREKISGAFYELGSAHDLADFKKLEQDIRVIQAVLPARFEGVIKDLKELLELKLEMFLLNKSKEAKENIEALYSDREVIFSLKKRIEDIEDAPEFQELLNSSLSLKDSFKNEKTGIYSGMEDLLKIKIYMLIKEEELEITKLLRESALADSGRSFAQELVELISENRDEESIPKLDKLRQKIKKLENMGFISKLAAEKSEKAINNIRGLLAFKVNDSAIRKKEFKAPSAGLNLDENSSDLFGDLRSQIDKAWMLAELENIKEKTGVLLEVLAKKGFKAGQVAAVKQDLETMIRIRQEFIMERIFAEMRKNINQLRDIDLNESGWLEEYLAKIKSSVTPEEQKRWLESLKRHTVLRNQNLAFPEKTNGEKTAKSEYAWHIFMCPANLVIPVNSSVFLKPLAIYNGTFIQEIEAESEWFSSNPLVATVDDKGMVHSLSKGTAEITARYKGFDSEKAEITVVDKVNGEIVSAIKKEFEAVK